MKTEREMRHGGFRKNGRCHYGRVDVDPVFGDGSSRHMALLEHHHEANQRAGPASSSSSSGRNCLPIPSRMRNAFRKLWSELRGYALAILAKPNDVKGQASKNNEADKEKSSRDDSGSSDSVKKHKREGPAMATVRMEATKLRLGDKITTLQQIVSPFGKTDTASVLLETCTYIKFLHDQVRLLAGDPCSKANTYKDLRGGLDREERIFDTRVVDLRSKGLCLAPVSGTWVYRDDAGSAILSKPLMEEEYT